jgi:hypothetical protein
MSASSFALWLPKLPIRFSPFNVKTQPVVPIFGMPASKTCAVADNGISMSIAVL